MEKINKEIRLKKKKIKKENMEKINTETRLKKKEI